MEVELVKGRDGNSGGVERAQLAEAASSKPEWKPLQFLEAEHMTKDEQSPRCFWDDHTPFFPFQSPHLG